MTDNAKIPFWLGFIILMIATAFLIIGSILIMSNIFKIKYWSLDDFENWAAVIIEIGIGVFISGMILLYDRKHKRRSDEQQDKFAKIVTSIDSIISDQKKANDRRTNYAYNRIRSELDRMESWVQRVNGLTESYQDAVTKNTDKDHEENIKTNYKQWFGFANAERDDNIRSLESMRDSSFDVLEPSHLEDLNLVIRLGKEFVIPWYLPEFQPTIMPRTESTTTIIANISSLRSKLPNQSI